MVIAKNILLLIVLSVIAIYFQTQLMDVLRFLMYVHAELAKGLGVIFTVNAVGEVVQSVIALLLIPAVIAVLFGIAHFFIRQHHFPHIIAFVWVCWAVLLAAVLSQTGRVSDHDMTCMNKKPTTPATGQVAGAPGQKPGTPMAVNPAVKGLPSPANTQPGKPGANPAENAAPQAPTPAPQKEEHRW